MTLTSNLTSAIHPVTSAITARPGFYSDLNQCTAQITATGWDRDKMIGSCLNGYASALDSAMQSRYPSPTTLLSLSSAVPSPSSSISHALPTPTSAAGKLNPKNLLTWLLVAPLALFNIR